MEILSSIFKLFAGVGLFLFAMYLIEESLKNLSGRNFKLFLQKSTKNRLGAVSGGAIVTGVLQSSSMVSLMVLAFVGAGVFTMKNAMAIILGANLGTTLDSWLVATLGFKTNIEIAAYPAVFAGGLLLILLGKKKGIKYFSYFLFGFGLLFIALSFMKTAMEVQVNSFDFSVYASMSPAVFLLIGFVITLLVQSSSVTMALTLSALHVGAITFPLAAAIVLGSETGTTIKIILSAIGGNAAKKQVVLGNFLFNIFLTVFAFLLLKPIIVLITDVFQIRDPLIGLVTFSSLINLFSIIVFIPLLDPFAKFLGRFFSGTNASDTAFIDQANINEPQTATDLFEKEVGYFIHNSILFNLQIFEIDTRSVEDNSDFRLINENRKFFTRNFDEKYDFLKRLQGELQSFYIKLRAKVDEDQSDHLNRLISAVRSSMYSVKCVNDIRSNLSNLQRSSKDIKFDFFLSHKKESEILFNKLNNLILRVETVNFQILLDILNKIQVDYTSSLSNFYIKAQDSPIVDLDLTTAINFNHALFTSDKAMLMAAKDLLLNEKEAEAFNEIPVYKT